MTRLEKQIHGFLNTPALWINNDFFEFSQFLFSSKPIPDKEQLKTFFPIITKSPILGKRIELFFRLIIQSHPNYKLLAENIQINSPERTLGELDFIIEEFPKKRIIHLELMYKFYVYDPEIKEEMARWIGPNKKDTLIDKLNRVKFQQFPVLKIPETKKLLETLQIELDEIEQEVCFKANLFIPEDTLNLKFPYINPECIAGFWIKYNEFTLSKYGEHQFITPEKQDWMMHPKYGEEWVAYAHMLSTISELNQRNRSPLIWMKKRDGSFHRFFIVWW
ncbi:DUF1853 family protein [Gillisia sp. M10.2A]|uniref:DUF1853 family protein n=1 Tax=Gillisia lutea TaxID=2909668 RepID=A0ABS9EH83_9FLAO|nr:DUF1853 family protein [Gillisia lutea]MCF4101514.1 DUF1853 family protein [Gillisia lutea]